MSNSLTDGLEVEEFLHIIANTCQKLNSFNVSEEQKDEKSKSELSSMSANREDINKNKSEIFSIKVVTQKKTVAEIVQLIKAELQIVDNDLYKWNSMMQASKSMSIPNEVQLDGVLSFYN